MAGEVYYQELSVAPMGWDAPRHYVSAYHLQDKKGKAAVSLVYLCGFQENLVGDCCVKQDAGLEDILFDPAGPFWMLCDESKVCELRVNTSEFRRATCVNNILLCKLYVVY